MLVIKQPTCKSLLFQSSFFRDFFFFFHKGQQQFQDHKSSYNLPWTFLPCYTDWHTRDTTTIRSPASYGVVLWFVHRAMSYKNCSLVVFIKNCEYTLRVENITKRNFARKKIEQFKACKKCKNCKIFHVHRIKKFANKKTRKETAKLAKVSALMPAAD